MGSTANRERALPAAWPAFAAMGVVALLALGMVAADLEIAHTTASATDQLLGNSLRSIELAADLRYEASRLATSGADAAEVARIAAAIRRDARDYEPLATEAGERAEFDHAAQLLSELRDHRDPSLIAPIEDSMARLVAMNELGAQRSAARIAAADDHEIAVDSIAAAITLASLGAIAFVLARSLRRQRELTREHLALLTERHRELEAFAARASHDLKGPLSPLGGYADLLTLEESARARMLGERIRKASDRMTQLVDDLLALSVAGRPAPGTVAVAPAVREITQELRAELGDVDLVVDVADATAACSASVLGQILRNLLSNAGKYRAPERRLAVHVTGRRTGEGIELVVRDNGRGMTAEAAARALEPFYRASSEVPGHGLGLSIVQRAIDAVGGSIALASTPGEGTTVTLRFPAA